MWQQVVRTNVFFMQKKSHCRQFYDLRHTRALFNIIGVNMIALLLKGLMIGFAIAAPVGPIGILCINRTLKAGTLAGLISGLGAAVADACYGCVAGFGLVSISQFLLAQADLIRLLGGVILIILGIKTFLSSSKKKALTDKANTLWEDFLSTLLLTLTNPATIISFIAIYASLGIVEKNANYSEAITIVLGVFLGSLIWWGILCSIVGLIRHKLSDTILKWINWFSGAILLGFGIFALSHGML